MRLTEVPDLPAGAVRRYGPRAGCLPPEGTADVLGGEASTLLVAAGPTAIAAYRARHLRHLLHVDAPFRATFAACGVVFAAVDRGDGTELVRWDVARGEVASLARLPPRCAAVGTDPDAARVAVLVGNQLAVHDGASGRRLWSRAAADALETLRLPVDELLADGDAAVIYASCYDPDEPDHTYASARVTAAGPIATRRERLDDGFPPSWYRPRPRVGGSTRLEEDAALLAVAADGSRVATPTRAWQVPGGEPVEVATLGSWYTSSFRRQAGDDVPVALAYDAARELWRVCVADTSWFLESCHARRRQVRLPDARCAAVVPGSRRLVVATDDQVRLDDQVLLAGVPALAVACADDGSAIAVAVGDRVETFAATGAAIATLPLPSTAGLAVARGGGAVACVDRAALAIVTASGIVRGPADARGRGQAVAFAPDGAWVAYATSAWGFAVVDAATAAQRGGREDLPGLVTAVAFAPDGAALFTLCASGLVFEWSAPAFGRGGAG